MMYLQFQKSALILTKVYERKRSIYSKNFLFVKETGETFVKICQVWEC